jgi:pimeloyl-ACP methyl ester carboxylesterase
MPDTMIQTETAAPPSGAGILEGYRSNTIGALVLARAKATAEIKKVVKDKSAKVESRKDGRSYSYSYADLADVMEAVDDALAAQELALFQTMQDRRGTVLVTTLAHSSGEWIASEVRLADLGGGPQVFGSSLTYMRRYSALAVLGIAPDSDDDGKAAQDRADQARQRPAQRADRPARADTIPRTAGRIQQAPSDSGGPDLMQIPLGVDGSLLIGKWVSAAKAALDGRPEPWRRAWLEMHQFEIDEVRKARRDWADKLESIAVAPDLAPMADAAE